MTTVRTAAAWAAAVSTIADLSAPRGISPCLRLRLLVRVELMGRAGWARAWFTLSRAGTEISAALPRAAALAPLNDSGGFDEAAWQALLPGTARRE